jgi:hypothetical protein
MTRAATAVVIVLLAFSVPALAAPRRARAARANAPSINNAVISRITIRGTDIFDLDLNPKIRRFPYTWINGLHIKTREEVVRQQLLFKVGDKLDPFLISETERNLRALSFIRAARIAKYPQRDGTVALVVHVNDAWTTEPQLNLGGINKVEETEVGFKEKNLFGLGKTVEFLYSEGEDFTRREYKYFDPRLFGTWFQLKGEFTDESDGSARRVQLERPFYSADTRFSTRGIHERSVFDIEEFENNEKVSEFEQTKEVSEVAAAMKVGGGRKIVNHLGLRYKREGRWFDETPETSPLHPIPEDRMLQTVFLDFETGIVDFVEMTHLEKMTRIEDINLGPAFKMSPGYAPRSLTGQKASAQLESSFEKRFLLHDSDLFYQRFSYSGRDTFKKGENEMFEILLKYYRRPSEFHTTVFNTRVNWGNDLDVDNLIRLGSENGLRAQEEDRFVGTKSWVMNIEERLFLVDELWNLLAIGAVAFVDSGYAWPGGRPVSISRVRSDIGTGLRFGLTRSANEVILRFDISYRLQTDERDSSRWVFTFGSGQAF